MPRQIVISSPDVKPVVSSPDIASGKAFSYGGGEFNVGETFWALVAPLRTNAAITIEQIGDEEAGFKDVARIEHDDFLQAQEVVNNESFLIAGQSYTITVDIITNVDTSLQIGTALDANVYLISLEATGVQTEINYVPLLSGKLRLWATNNNGLGDPSNVMTVSMDYIRVTEN